MAGVCNGGGATSAHDRRGKKAKSRAEQQQRRRHGTQHLAQRPDPRPREDKCRAAGGGPGRREERRHRSEPCRPVRVVAHRDRVVRLLVLPRSTHSRSVNFAEGADQLDLATERMAYLANGAGARLQSPPSQPLDLALASGILGAAGAAVRVLRPYGQEEEAPDE